MAVCQQSGHNRWVSPTVCRVRRVHVRMETLQQESPWVLKVSQGDRTLMCATPMADAFEGTVVLGERAAQAALAGRASKPLHASIRAAKPYVEGRPVRVMVKGQADVARVEELVAVKLNPTGEAAMASSVRRRRSPTQSWS